MVGARIKTLGWDHKAASQWNTQSRALLDTPPVGGGWSQQDQDVRSNVGCFGDPLIKFPQSVIMISKFPTRNLKAISMFYFKNDTQRKIGGSRKLLGGFAEQNIMIQHNPIVRSCHVRSGISLNFSKAWN